MKTFASILAVSLGLTASNLSAAGSNDQLRTFATCAGRLSAVMEFQWLLGGDVATRTEQQRAAVVELIGAIMTPEEGRTVLHWRVSAKHAQYALLSRATFSSDPVDAAWAADLAERRAMECTALLLG